MLRRKIQRRATMIPFPLISLMCKNKDLFTIDNHGNTTRISPSQSPHESQEIFLKWIEEGHEVRGLLLPLVDTEIIMQDIYDAVKATIENSRGLCLQHHVIHMVTRLNPKVPIKACHPRKILLVKNYK
jgi:hypothetical protein